MREERPAVWILEESFTGPDGRARVRRSPRGPPARDALRRGRRLPARAHVPGPEGRAARAPPRPCGRSSRRCSCSTTESTPPHPAGEADIEAELDGVRSRLWRVDDDEAIAAAVDRVRGPLVIADGHHRYETALRFHETEGGEETAYVLAALVLREDPGLEIFPTHRVVSERLPELNGRFRVAELDGDARAAARAPRGAAARPSRLRRRPPGRDGARRDRAGGRARPASSTRRRSTGSRSATCASRRASTRLRARSRPARRRAPSSSARRPWSRCRRSRSRARRCPRRRPTSSRS